MAAYPSGSKNQHTVSILACGRSVTGLLSQAFVWIRDKKKHRNSRCQLQVCEEVGCTKVRTMEMWRLVHEAQMQINVIQLQQKTKHCICLWLNAPQMKDFTPTSNTFIQTYTLFSRLWVTISDWVCALWWTVDSRLTWNLCQINSYLYLLSG